MLCVAVLILPCTSVQSATGGQGSKALDSLVHDMNGSDVALEQYRGENPLLLVFFATWCPPCKQEVPELIRITNSYKEQGLLVCAVSVDNARSVLPPFIEKKGINYTVLHDGYRTAAEQYKVSGIPTNMLIDRNGIIIFRGNRLPSPKEIDSVLN